MAAALATEDVTHTELHKATPKPTNVQNAGGKMDAKHYCSEASRPDVEECPSSEG